MKIKKIFSAFNLFYDCADYDLPLWQCPQFVFFIMGILTIIATIITFVLGNRYIDNQLLVNFLVLFLACIMLVVSFIITSSFERLAEAGRMKSEFVRIVSHQLKSPLTNLKWALEALFRTKSYKGEEMKCLEILKENSERMEELAYDLGVISRLRENSLFLKEGEIDIKETISQIIKRLDPLIKARNLAIDIFVKNKVPNISTDPSQFKLVIEILLENAISYSKPQGKIEVFLEKSGPLVKISVKDGGVGIPESDKKHIFKQFFRGKNVVHYKPEGTGLGLFIAKSVVRRLQGTMGFESEEGRGSTFWFSLPKKR